MKNINETEKTNSLQGYSVCDLQQPELFNTRLEQDADTKSRSYNSTLARKWGRMANIGTAISYAIEGMSYITGAAVGSLSVEGLMHKPNVIGLLGVAGAVVFAISGYKFHQEETLNIQRISREYQRRISLLESKLKGGNEQ